MTDGPVLTMTLASAVLVEPSINPLLLPPNDEGRTFIEWNMLYPHSYARPSLPLSTESWSDLLREPATFPRLSNMHIISPAFPWTIDIRAETQDVALTCHDVIEQLHKFLYKFITDFDMDTAPPKHRHAMWESFDASRTPPDGLPGRLLINKVFNGLRRVEWLCGTTVFLGLDSNNTYIRQRLNTVLPGTFVLSCGNPSADNGCVQHEVVTSES
ncbi:hypothetical protein PLICRDRAFT_109835 [Plicaturopsis crispa FD-325 SS-3]|nr:hypothetical protein PLICRDRAFT_109835 [Plicaturopsis crispa FD-325 SS-3]